MEFPGAIRLTPIPRLRPRGAGCLKQTIRRRIGYLRDLINQSSDYHAEINKYFTSRADKFGADSDVATTEQLEARIRYLDERIALANHS
ncbi:MAG: hypothetical protein JO329_01165 [Planctomycetaceae bacterium]|nr:hypothetical protein [Planctomycetaceae bacterium]MBV8318490.1 hypothetical protein [Planctomycetaceae bacterium]MBV8382677.1 hypothetical protein [Planctomycetaceae bacterium]MBV8606204.1 hypothetical protein [Singulisphaera sp.]